jgi:hypothetical protein
MNPDPAFFHPDVISCGQRNDDQYFCYACNKSVKMPPMTDCLGTPVNVEGNDKCPNCGRPVWEYLARIKRIRDQWVKTLKF